jgi:hypothetical protein
LLHVFFTDLFIPDGLVTKIEEVCFKPKHEYCNRHWIYRITLEDVRCYAVSFTDRQLGWLPIVVPWDIYPYDCIKRVFNSPDLGAEREENWRMHDRSWLEIESPPYDMVLEQRLADWVPDESVSDNKHWDPNAAFKCRVDLRVEEDFAAWKNGEWTLDGRS